MRFALGAAGLAALSALAAGIVLPPNAALVVQTNTQATQSTIQSAAGTPAVPIAVQQPIQYVHLGPGQTAPPGATVIDPAAPQPTTIVTTVAAPVQQPVIIKTTQSGKVVP